MVSNSTEKSDRKEILEESKENGESLDGKWHLTELWDEWREETSVHGLKFTFCNGKYRLRWLIWTVALLIMVALLLQILTVQLIGYLRRRTIADVSVEHVKRLAFPAVTICSMSPFKRSAMNLTPELEQLMLDTKGASMFYDSDTVPNFTNPIFDAPRSESSFETSSFTVEDFIVMCAWGMRQLKCIEENMFVKTVSEYGMCYTFNHWRYIAANGTRMITRSGIASALTLYIKVNESEYTYSPFLSAGMRIVIHDPSVEPDVPNMAFLVAPGFSTNAVVKQTNFIYPPEYKAQGNRYCVDRENVNIVNPLFHYPSYSEYGCLRECKRNYVVSFCGCRLDVEPGPEKLCSWKQIYNCYLPRKWDFENTKSLADPCVCNIPCEFTQYTVQTSMAVFPSKVYKKALQEKGYEFNDEWTDYLELNVFFDSLTYTEVHNRPEFSQESIIGILGGQIGLFVGASILSVTEMVEFIVIVIIVTVYRIFQKLKNKRKNSKEDD